MSTQTVIVTGGAAGIGRATVERFFASGANVAVWDVDATRGGALVAELDPSGTRTLFQAVDVTTTSSVTDAVAHIPARPGCSCHQALATAILTDRSHWPAGTKRELAPILAPYLRKPAA